MKPKPTHSDAIRLRVVQAIKSIIAADEGPGSRSAIAKRILSSSQAISKWEHKKGYPTLENIAWLVQKFPDFVTPDFLFLGQKKSKATRSFEKRLSEVEKKVEIIKMDSKKSGKKR